MTKDGAPAAFDDDVNGEYAFQAEHATSDQAFHGPNGDLSTRNHAVNGNQHPGKSTGRQHELTRAPASYGPDYDTSRVNGSHQSDSISERVPASRNGATGRRATTDSKPGHIDGMYDENSKWIHRDKLAQIESEELQAAGFILPKPRSHSRVRKDARQSDQSSIHQKAGDGAASEHAPARSRKNSAATDRNVGDAETPAWDLRLPDEIAEEDSAGFCVANGLSKGGTRIPVAKLSPAPIPLDYLERPTPVSRKNTSDGISLLDVDSISYQKPRSRSASMKQQDGAPTAAPAGKRTATDASPRKPTTSAPGSRKPSSRVTSASQRPKTRSGANKDSISSSNGTRPSTRSGELNLGSSSSKQPEGEPPWMLSAYKPDPRLPPDQQLLPTVARRLQQEKWEKEGKFGNVLDKEFRPLTDDGFGQPPEKREGEPEPKSPDTDAAQPDQWPLSEQVQRSTTPKPNSYSTMPRIQDKPPQGSPLSSPMRHSMQQQQPMSPGAARPEQQEAEKQGKGGCGCCVVM